MKKILSILVFLAILVSLSACANNSDKDQLNENETSPDLSAIYAPVLESWEKAIQENFGYSKETQDEKSYPFICQSLPNEFAQAHYAYYDIDGNGNTELLIASFSDSGYYHLADVFAVQNGKPVRLFEGVEDRGFWSRNRLDFSKDGKSLVVSGSSGAAYTNTDFYKVAENGYQVELLEGLTTYNPDDLDDLTRYYHLPDGTYEIATDFDKVMEKYYDKRYLDGSESLDYFSDFHTQINWQPIGQALNETFTVIAETFTCADAAPDASIFIEYIQITGLSDLEKQERINNTLRESVSSFVRDWESNPEISDLKTYEIYAEYAIIGDILSLQEMLSYYNLQAAHPWVALDTMTIDVSTGNKLNLSDIMILSDSLSERLTEEFVRPTKLVLDEHDEDLMQGLFYDRLFDCIKDGYSSENSFYLTEETIGFIMEVPHAAGDYWTFEIAYDDLHGFLKPDFQSSSVKNIEYTALTAILNEVEPDYEKNVYLLRTMYDEKQNLFWIEFYDTESYLSSLWLGFVIIDSTNYNVVHTETNVQLFSGISPEMAVDSRKAKTELHNEYGDFYIR